MNERSAGASEDPNNAMEGPSGVNVLEKCC